MPNILSLPQDVHSIVWSNLDLQDVIRLRQTCSTLSSAISGDKQFWVHVFDRYVKARSLCVPYNLRGVEDVDAHVIESWVKHAIILDRNYATADRNLSVRRIENRRGLGITWLKLILGHWCLIASADAELSELSMWEIASEGELRLAAKIYLQAPVIDGQIDDCSRDVRCAITVGVSVPYILILGISQSSKKAAFSQLAEIPDASHVRFLRGDLVGFAARKGDDTYPYMANWKTGSSYSLCLPHSTSPQRFCPLPIESCITMTIWNGYIFTMHRTAIQVFAMSDVSNNGSHTGSKHVAVLPFLEQVGDGQFLDASAVACGIEKVVAMRVYFQDTSSRLRQALIMFDERRGKMGAFSMIEALSKNPPNVPGHRYLHRYQLGSSGKVVLCMTSLKKRRWWSPVISLASVRAPTESSDSHPLSTFGDYISVSKDNLPLPHLLSCVDFDDGNGLLLMGTISGDVRLASSLSSMVLAPESVRSDLNMASDASAIPTPQRIYQLAVNLDLPIFYYIRKSHKFGDRLPLKHVEQVVRQWQVQNNGLRPFLNWSNDWLAFERIWNWIAPLSRWGALDADFMDMTPSVSVRNRLQALGEIIPILYDVHNHCRVIFRVGERLFYLRSRREDEDDEGEYDFEDHMEDILGVLPLTYSQFLSHPTSILPSLSNVDIQRNLTSWLSPDSLHAQMNIADAVYAIRDHCEHSLKARIDDAMMEHWSNDDWDKNYDSAVGLKDRLYFNPEP